MDSVSQVVVNPAATIKTGVHSVDKISKKRMALKSSNAVKTKILWRWIILLAMCHVGVVYGLYLVFASAKFYTTVFGLCANIISAIGITTAGYHRLWTHKSFKAKWPLRILLMLMSTLTFEGPIYNWYKYRQLHHKYTDTNSDPHNSKKRFFSSHVGWLLVHERPDYCNKFRKTDVTDLKNDPIVRFQSKYFLYLTSFLCFYLPTVIPVYFWNETYVNAFFIVVLLRWGLTVNFTFLVNSAAQIKKNQSYNNACIKPTKNLLVSAVSLGEGWQYYHHVFPWDHKTAEHGDSKANSTTAYSCDHLAEDIKTGSNDLISKRTLPSCDSDTFWEWNDSNLLKEDSKLTTVLTVAYF